MTGTRSGTGLVRETRLADVLTCAVLITCIVLPGAGRTSFDTKLDLTVDPVGFLARSLHVWNPDGGLGQLQNQAVGYLFPIGPFFALGDLLGTPGWLVQRAWQSLLVVGAYAGVRRLADRLGLGAGWPAWAGALAYALCPRMVTTLGPISAEALAVTMAPWILLPLVQPERAGSPRRAAARSAAAVLLLGGVNGAVTLAVLPLPLLWLLTRAPGSARRRLLAWWSVLTAAACAWWFVPLTVLGRYGPPFLDHIETAQHTTGPITPFEGLRGTTHWVAFFTRNAEPWWPAGWQLVTGPWLVLSTTAVAAVGMAGLARRDMPARRPLVLAFATGLLLVSLGGAASGATSLGEVWQHVLDGPLVPFRNIHKFDPVLRLPLALGLVHVMRQLSSGVLARRWASAGPSAGSVLHASGAALTVVAVVLPVWPLAAGPLRPGQSWQHLPVAWEQVADYLAAESGDDGGPDAGRALLVPSSGFGEYVWGRTVDEPLQPLARSAWAVRDQAPLSAVGSVRLLDGVEQVLVAGRPSPGLAPALARSGIRFLVVRNDLDWTRTGSPRPAVVHAVVDHSPGLRRVASFGSAAGPAQDAAGRVLEYGVDGPRPAIEVYEVEDGAPRVRAVAADEVTVLSGGPESLLPAVAGGALAPDRPVVLTGDDPPGGLRGWLLTDGLRRRDRDAGRVHGNLSNTLTAGEPSGLSRRVADLLPFAPEGHQTVALLSGVSAVAASSSAGSAASLAATRPEHQPFAALDADPSTSWRSSAPGSPVGQFLRVRLPSARDLTGLTVTLEDGVLLGPRITAARVTTDHGDRVTRLTEAGPAVLRVAPGATRSVTLTVADAEPGDGAVGVRELALPGVVAHRTLLLPDDGPAAGTAGATGPDAVVLADDMPPRRACVPVDLDRPELVRCDPVLRQGSEDEGALDRTFQLDGGRSYELAATVVPRGQTGLARYLDPVAPGLTARASSALGDDLAVRPGAAVDGDPATAWVASPDDPAPQLTLTWPRPRTLSSVRVLASEQPRAARPQRLELTAAGRSWAVDLTAGDTARFPPVETTSLTVRFVTWERTVSVDRSTTLVTRVPAGVAELQLPELADWVYRPRMDSPIGELCGTGPTLAVDGVPVPTQITATLGDLVSGRPLTARTCGAGSLQELGAGRHHVVADSPEWLVTGATLRAPPTRDDGTIDERSTTVAAWSPSHRVVEVSAGGPALLVVQESQNDGWVATAQGRLLERATVDGWQQAWVLPAGGPATVTLEFVPQRTHVLGLGIGAALAALVVALALLPPGRRAGGVLPPGRRAGGVLPTASDRAGRSGALAMVVPVLLAGWLGLACVIAASIVRRPVARLVPLAVVGCPVAAALLVVGGRAGVVDVGSGDAVVQALVLLPVALVVTSLRVIRRPRHRADGGRRAAWCSRRRG